MSVAYNLVILPGNADGAFGAPIYTSLGDFAPGALALADLNGDGMLDVVVGEYVLLGNGNGTFQLAATLTVGNLASGQPVIADFNGDGKLDIAIDGGINPQGVVSIFMGNGDGTFQLPLGFIAGNSPVAAAAGDFNNDGKPDLAVANSASNNITILTNTTQ